MSTVIPFGIVVIVGSVGTAALLAAVGTLLWLIWRAGKKKSQRQ